MKKTVKGWINNTQNTQTVLTLMNVCENAGSHQFMSNQFIAALQNVHQTSEDIN